MLHPCAASVLCTPSGKTPRRTRTEFPTRLIDTLRHPRRGHGLTSKTVSVFVVCSMTFSPILFSEVDHDQLECPLPPIPPLCDHKFCMFEGNAGCWPGYPCSRFPNWTYRQMVKSKIYAALTEYPKDVTCILHRIDVDKDGFFTNPGPLVAKPGEEREAWDQLIGEEVSMISA